MKRRHQGTVLSGSLFPGIDRPLKKDSDYVDHYGKKIDVSFYAPFEGKKVQTYELVSHDEAHLVVKNFKKQKVTLERSLISSVRPHLDFKGGFYK